MTMTQQSDNLSSSIIVDFAEQKYTRKFLDEVADFAFEREEDIVDYAKFYVENQPVGYAFHKLKVLFEKIDMFIGVKSSKATGSPWDYFSDVEALATFSKKIIELTEKLQVSPEPLAVEKIRIADLGGVRKQMLKRIINLEPSRRTFDGEILDHLRVRHEILNSFCKAVHIERDREKASKRSTSGGGLRQRKFSAKETDSSIQIQEEEPIKSRLSPLATTWLVARLKRASNWVAWVRLGRFIGRQSTVTMVSILSITVGLALSCLALYISVAAKADRDPYTASLLNAVGQNVLLGVSLYVLVLPFLHGVRLNNEKIWFIVSFSIGTIAAVCSVVTLRWAAPVSAFLGNLANAAQILATLLLLQCGPLDPSILRSVQGEESGVQSEGD